MIVENAKIEDIDLLTESRLTYLKEDHGKFCETDIKIVKQDLPNYFKNNLNENIFCYLMRDKEKIVACAFLLMVEKPISPAFITGKTGTVLNVLTFPIFSEQCFCPKGKNAKTLR